MNFKVAERTATRAWSEQHNGVSIERVDTHAGWAVHSGSDGEDPKFVAFFAGRDGKRRAQNLTEQKHLVEGEEEPEVFSPSTCPAVLYGSIDDGADCGLFVANDYREEESIEVLCVMFGFNKEDFGT